MKRTLWYQVWILALASLSASKELKGSSSVNHGFSVDDGAWHHLCDKRAASTLPPGSQSPAYACFDTKHHVAKSIQDAHFSSVHGVIDGSGRRFALFPDATIMLKNLEIHVRYLKDTEENKRDREEGCVDVKVYHLPKRNIQVRETWCPVQFQPVIL
ncbi:related to conserved hypothetical Ustilaginaceae-specific protein [Melanopsichium pennsylvanicum]|uniref:Related to conserved hypothetical Ustilaginaceae-specific protein n=1 Tax=Melanopsichium pennsylvanicum TaxID=63383 RepID=A0AAJ4XHZ0_9BASI|nr:related to conserved hypothetical Ustilaginaceae-specific protein [Melanopsichium pennsylvanicum]